MVNFDVSNSGWRVGCNTRAGRYPHSAGVKCALIDFEKRESITANFSKIHFIIRNMIG